MSSLKCQPFRSDFDMLNLYIDPNWFEGKSVQVYVCNLVVAESDLEGRQKPGYLQSMSHDDLVTLGIRTLIQYKDVILQV